MEGRIPRTPQMQAMGSAGNIGVLPHQLYLPSSEPMMVDDHNAEHQQTFSWKFKFADGQIVQNSEEGIRQSIVTTHSVGAGFYEAPWNCRRVC